MHASAEPEVAVRDGVCQQVLRVQKDSEYHWACLYVVFCLQLSSEHSGKPVANLYIAIIDLDHHHRLSTEHLA
jgi:hypothetical protein